MTAHECKSHNPNCWRCDLSRAEMGTDGRPFQQCEHGFHHPSWPHSCDGCYGCDVPPEYRREPSAPRTASASPAPVPEVGLRSYVDPVANAEVQRLRAKVARVEALAETQEMYGGQFSRNDIRQALADPEEDQ